MGARIWMASALAAVILITGHLTSHVVSNAGAQTIVICDATPSSAPLTQIGESGVSSEGAPFDLIVIDRLIANHAGAIALANVGLLRATDTDVRRIALRVAESHAGELQLLRHWRDLWFPSADNTLLLAGGTSEDESSHLTIAEVIAALCASTDGFDRLFLERMRLQLLAGIELANEALMHAERSEITEFVKTIIEARRDDISLISRLLDPAVATPNS